MDTGSKSGATSPTNAAPWERYSPTLSNVMPEVGLILSMGSANGRALTHMGPPVTPGKSFCSGTPARYTDTSSARV